MALTSTRRIIKSNGTIVDAAVEAMEPGELVGHALSFSKSEAGDSDAEEAEWGERTGMERRLTDLLFAQLAEARARDTLLLAALRHHPEPRNDR